MFPMPATTDWSISSWPIATLRFRTFSTKVFSASGPSSLIGSGPSLSSAFCTPAGSSTTQAVGPRRSATVSSVRIRTRTWPTGSGGKDSIGSSAFSCSAMR